MAAKDKNESSSTTTSTLGVTSSPKMDREPKFFDPDLHSDDVEEPPPPPPVIVVMHEIEAEEEIPEASNEVEVMEEIAPHLGWIPIKYRWEILLMLNRYWAVVMAMGDIKNQSRFIKSYPGEFMYNWRWSQVFGKKQVEDNNGFILVKGVWLQIEYSKQV